MAPGPLRKSIPAGIVALAFVAGALLTHPISMGDTIVFVLSVAARLRGGNYAFWDAGHLLWRPVGTIATFLAQRVTEPVDPVFAAYRTMVGINFLAGLGCSLLLLSTLRQLGVRTAIATFMTVVFELTHGFLSYTQSATSYVSGLFFLILAYHLAIRARASARSRTLAVLAGVSGAIATGFWLPYVFVLPGVALGAGMFAEQHRSGPAIRVLAGAAVTGFAMFVGMALALGHDTFAEFIHWVRSAGHGISGYGGVPRTVLGFGRSLAYVGDDGAVLRRFLHGDALNPVSLVRALATRVWLIAFIWLAGVAVVASFVRHRCSPRMLALLAGAAVPVFAFAVLWQGGDIPRYFPLFPALFLFLAVFLNQREPGMGLRLVVVAGLLLISVSNLAGLAVMKLDGRREAVVRRLERLEGRARPDDFVYSSHAQDDALRYTNSRPFDVLVKDTPLQFRYLVRFGTPELPEWRVDFSRRVYRSWGEGRQVWISTRLLEPAPRPEWDWIEGTDPRISWSHFAEFFSRFEFNDPVDDDGFVRIEPTARNRLLIEEARRPDRVGGT